MVLYREKEFDLMKGVGMLLIIISHCPISKSFHDFVYFFHVPLFFVISGYFFRQRNFIDELRLGVRRLIVPYVFVSAVLILCKFFCDDGCFTMVKALLLGTGFNCDFSAIHIGFSNTVGPLWFLLAMFWGRLLLSLLLKIKKDMVIVCVVIFCSFVFVNVKTYFFSLPLSIIPGICSVGFMIAGFYMRKYNFFYEVRLYRYAPFLCLSWLFCMIPSGNLDVNMSSYKGFYLLDVLGNAFVFWSFFLISKSIELNNSLAKLCHWIGRYSLVVLCVHSIDYNLILYRWFYAQIKILLGIQSYSLYIVILIRIILAIFSGWLLLKIPFIKQKIFYIRTN